MTLDDFDTIEEAIEYVRLDVVKHVKAKNWGASGSFMGKMVNVNKVSGRSRKRF